MDKEKRIEENMGRRRVRRAQAERGDEMIGQGDWWAVSFPGRPTFYLDAGVQGFTGRPGARRVAMRVMHGEQWEEKTTGLDRISVSVEHLGRERAAAPSDHDD
jgi:hypothetical protein